jgi:hypothetical protein
MRQFHFLVTVLTAAAVALAAAAVAPPASAQNLSPGCQALNDPVFDFVYGASGVPSMPFAKGEVISASAGEPTAFAPPVTVILGVNTVEVDTAAFPGTVEFVIPAAGDYSVLWAVHPEDVISLSVATWTVKCEAPDPAQAIADLQALVSGFGLPAGLTTALTSKLQEALAAHDAGDTAGACDSLQAFLNQVRAQEGKKLTAAQAQQLTQAAIAIQALLDC